jgi:hypothetical protein
MAKNETSRPPEMDIRALAYEFYKREGGGDPVKHWLEAEAVLLRQRMGPSTVSSQPPPRPAPQAERTRLPQRR